MARVNLRKAFGEPPGSLAARAASVGIGPKCTVREILDAFDDDVVFEQPLVTADGVALGGHFKLVLHRDGQFDFTGYFHATGWPSYRASLLVTAGFEVSAPGGTPTAFQLAFAASGSVHGTSEPGDDYYHWNDSGKNPLISANWSKIRNAAFARRLEYDADWFGPVGDLAAFFGQIILMNGAFGPAGTAIALLGTAADLADVEELMLPGLVGVAVAAGVVYFVAPGLMIPAFIGGVLATEALVEQDSLTAGEQSFADDVFAGTIPYDRIVKTNLTGVGDNGFCMPLPGGTILLNLGDLCYANPTTHDGWTTTIGEAAPGQMFIHELTHAWQIVHDSFTPWFYCRATATVTSTAWDDEVANYGEADVPWSDLGTEQQAALVCEWFGGSDVPMSKRYKQGDFEPMRDDSPPSASNPTAPNPYFRYIRDHIWAEVT